MKILVIILSLFVSSTVFGQLNSYADNNNEIRMMFDMIFATSDDAVFVIVGKEDFEFIAFMAKSQTKLESLRASALEEIGCPECEVFETKETSSPVGYVMDEMEEGDVYFITKKKDLYLLELYRKE